MKKLNIVRCFLGSLLLLLFAIPGIATADEVIAEVVNKGDSLIFYPVAEFNEMILTVTGPCDYQYREVVSRGEAVFRLDQTTIDGVYRFNLFGTQEVDPDIIKVLLAARQEADEETPKQLCRDGKLPGPPTNQAAGFRVNKGTIIYDPEANEKAFGNDADPVMDVARLASIKPTAEGMSRVPTKDFVINDDLIVDGSACIGFDCVNGESFSFDTIRLKENNLRIKFDDTSVAASFPRTDWQLTANASANGGASKFSIDDISGSRTPFTVEANARSHSLYVDDGGRIGNRTSTPSTEIHTIDGDTPTLRLQQDGSSGFAPQTWDVAGNETNFFIRDVSNGSTLPFRIRPGASTDSLFVDVDSEVGLGTASPGAKLHILESGTPISAFAETGLVVQNSAATDDFAGITLISGDTSNSQLNFGTTADEFQGRILYRPNTDEMVFRTAGVDRMTVDNSGDMTLTGEIFTSGSCAGGCDLVFSPDYELPSIEEHAADMWEKRHLPSVGPTSENGPFNLSQMTGNILNELEKAHIFIEQLNSTVKELRQELEELKAEKPAE